MAVVNDVAGFLDDFGDSSLSSVCATIIENQVFIFPTCAIAIASGLTVRLLQRVRLSASAAPYCTVRVTLPVDVTLPELPVTVTV
jgi:hypothetical protein